MGCEEEDGNKMAKFSGTKTRIMPTRPVAPVRTTSQRVPTFNGADGYAREAESELFLLTATNLVGEKTFYESASTRDERFVNLVREVTKINPLFIAGNGSDRKGLVRYAREDMFMRTAPLVMAAEYVRAGGPNGRSVVANALQRPDEPGEILGYWMSTYGKRIPAALKRGVADAVVRMFNQKNAIKYDGQTHAIRLADVIELTHPRPSDVAQSALFKHLIDKRHGRDTYPFEMDYVLPMIAEDHKLLSVPGENRRAILRQNRHALVEAGWSWERLSGWLPGGMDAEAWEAIIPSMGYMALLRNLRNFDEKGVSKEVLRRVAAKIADPVQASNSRQFPFRFWSAYKNAPSATWVSALEDAIDASTQNIPLLDGDTEIYIDVSGSMDATVSEKSSVKRHEIGALFAMSMFKRTGGKARVILFGTDNMEIKLSPSTSVLRGVEGVQQVVSSGRLGWSTNAYPALTQNYRGAQRVVFFTDEQVNPYGPRDLAVANSVPVIYTFNLAGYRGAMMPNGTNGRYALGGFSDGTFALMKALEEKKDANWPF